MLFSYWNLELSLEISNKCSLKHKHNDNSISKKANSFDKGFLLITFDLLWVKNNLPDVIITFCARWTELYDPLQDVCTGKQIWPPCLLINQIFNSPQQLQDGIKRNFIGSNYGNMYLTSSTKVVFLDKSGKKMAAQASDLLRPFRRL